MGLPEGTKEKVKEMLNEGMSSTKIANKLGIGKMQVAGIKAHMTIKEKNESITKEKSTEKISESSEDIPHFWSDTPPPKDSKTRTSILVGTDEVFNKKVYWDYHPKTGSVNPHVLITGETGVGKTYAAQCLVSELSQKGVSTVILDYGQGFGKEEANEIFLNKTDPSQIEASLNGVKINPLQIFPHDVKGPLNVAQRIADTFGRIYPKIGIQQKESIIKAVEWAFDSVGIDPEDESTWDKTLPPFSKVYSMLKKLAETQDHALKKPASSAYSHVSSFFRFNVMDDTGEKLSWEKIIKKEGGVWVIQLKGLDQQVSMITTEMLIWNLISFLQSKGPSDIKLFLVLDEAHKLSFERGSPVDWILREGRKFGVGGILASQQLDDYSKVAISNTATKLIFQNHDERHKLSKALAKKCRNISNYKKISDIITTLDRGDAFMLNENIGRIVEIDEIEKREGEFT